MRFGGVLLSPSMHRFLSVTCLAAATSFAVLACTHNAAPAQTAAPLAVLAAEPGVVPQDSARPLLLADEQLVLTAATGGDPRFTGPAFALPRMGGRAVALGRADVEDLRGRLTSGEIVAQGYELPLIGPPGGPLRRLALPPGAPTDGTREFQVYGDRDLVVLQSGDEVFIRRGGQPERKVRADGSYVRRVIGDLVVSETVGSEDAVQVRSAATWKVIATVKGLADGAYAVATDGTVTYALEDATIMRLSPGAATAQRLGRIAQLSDRGVDRLVLAGRRIVAGGGGVGVLEPDGSSHLSGPQVSIDALEADGDTVLWRGDGCVAALDPSGPVSELPAGGPCARTRIKAGDSSVAGRRLTLDLMCLSGPARRCTIIVRPPAGRAVRVRADAGEELTVAIRLRRAPDPFVGVALRVETSTEPDQPLRVTTYPESPSTIPGGRSCDTLTLGPAEEPASEVAVVHQRATTCKRAEAVARRLQIAPQSRLGRARSRGFACVRFPDSSTGGRVATIDYNAGTWHCRRAKALVLVTLY